MPVQLVLRPGLAYRGYAGQIASGTVKTGDEIVALPSGKRTRVVGVDVAGQDVGIADAPMSVALRLADEIDVSRGDMFARADDLPRATSELEADLVWMSERALDPEKTYLLKHTTRTVRARVEVVAEAGGGLSDLRELVPCESHGLALNDIGRVLVHCRAPIFCDPYRDNRITGAFILIDSVTNDTVAAGMVARSAAEPTRGVDPEARQVSAAERRERLGQTGAVVRVLASSLQAAQELAFTIERELFDGGRVATVLTGASATVDAAEACARAGLFALLPTAKTDQGHLAGQTDQGRFLVDLGASRLEGDDLEDLARRVAAALQVGAAPLTS